MENLKFVVSENEAKERIDKVLVLKMSDVSRSRLQMLIEDGDITVNNEMSRSNYKLRLNDVVECIIPEVCDLIAEAQDLPLDIIYEDSDIVVVNKDKGMVVHPAVGNTNGTLVNALLFHCKDLSGINGVLRPGIVHRIDKDTSGLLVVAKNDLAHVNLVDQLKIKSVSRKYYALVHGLMEHDYATIDAPIGRDVKERQKMAVTSTNSRDAKTHVRVIERYKDTTLVECRLETGRTHQIRVHMQYIGYPIVGDLKYSFNSTPNCQGQLLHAFELTLIHPRTKAEMTFNAPIPAQMQSFIDLCKEGGVKACK